MIVDEYFTSFPRYVFRYSTTESYTCLTCKATSNSENLEDEFSLSSSSKDNVDNMINQYLKSKVDKNCSTCKCNRYHNVSKSLSSPPRVLRMIINRFTDDGSKKHDQININTSLNICHINYSLLGIIHHAGSTVKSGHYFCTVKYITMLNINDALVTSQQISDLKSSQTAYILFYKSNSTT